MTTWFADPPHAATEFPTWAKLLGFEDRSWKNDACSLALLFLIRKGDDAQCGLQLWVSPANPAEREDAASGSYVQFALNLVSFGRNDQEYGTHLLHLYHGESSLECGKVAVDFVRMLERRSGT